jgi:hypothetical protein
MHARVSEILNRLGRHEESVAHKKQSIEFRCRHQDAQAVLLVQLQSSLSGLATPSS